MSQKAPKKSKARGLPKIESGSGENVQVELEFPGQLRRVLGVENPATAKGLITAALNALGTSGETYRELLVSVPLEMKPEDPLESMLITQLTVTHVAMCQISRKMFDAEYPQLRESYERSVTRLSRTYMAQMDALKKYRAKAQQTVRVERVTVEDGGQAIVGNVEQRGGDCEK